MVEVFDYVVVGGGPAGCAVAARLAQGRPDLTVALVEAGPAKSGILADVPLGLAVSVPMKSARNYAYETVPQAALGGRRGYAPRGRGLGGSSLINAMIYVRGQAEDYDSWAADAGCGGWSFSDLLPYFKRGENNERGADAFHGVGGPLNVADLRALNPVAAAFLEAAAQAGFVRNDDFNGESQEGVGPYQVTQKRGARYNAGRAYMDDLNHPNLTVIADTQVLRVVFVGKRATGVDVMRAAVRSTILARAEVIISAGAFSSPQLLMCSGIGPAAHLREHGIAVLVDSPDVGGNLQDHVDYTMSRKFHHRALFGSDPRLLPDVVRGWRQWKTDGTGMLATNVAEAGGFLKTQPELDRPDVQLHFCTGLVDDHGRRRHMFRGYSLHTCVLRPKSRGTVRLVNADMRSAPLIDPQFLSAPEDLQTLVRGVALSMRILGAPAMQVFDGPSLHAGRREEGEDLLTLIRENADTIYHPVGTCRMGGDAGSVLDPQLRVRGVEALRVVDGSVMPRLVSGNTQAPCAMIGERAADIIRGKNT